MSTFTNGKTLIDIGAMLWTYGEYEKAGLVADRNQVASKIFANAEFRNVSLVGNGSVETWCDRKGRNVAWVTQYKDAQGCQIGDALYAGNAVSASHNHVEILRKFYTLNGLL